MISPLRSSFFLVVHHFPLRSTIFLFGQVPPVTSAGFWVISPFARQSNLTPSFPLTFFLFVHHFSSSFIISPLRSSFLLFVHHFSSSFMISPLRSSFLLFVHHFSSSFIISPLRSSFLLFVEISGKFRKATMTKTPKNPGICGETRRPKIPKIPGKFQVLGWPFPRNFPVFSAKRHVNASGNGHREFGTAGVTAATCPFLRYRNIE